jgi:hypothetical protein
VYLARSSIPKVSFAPQGQTDLPFYSNLLGLFDTGFSKARIFCGNVAHGYANFSLSTVLRTGI